MSGDIVVVTGAAGYIASHLVQQLLAKGYRVRATVRDPADTKKVSFLTQLPGAAQRLTLHKADLLDDGSFDEAVNGAKFVFHTASPFTTKQVSDPQKQLVDPAVQGTRNVLSAVHKAASVQRVVLTSSIVAVYHAANDKTDGSPFTEEDWNTRSTLKTNAYALSKTEAERAAWEEEKKQSRWKLVVVNPGLVIGPTLSGRADAESIQLMQEMLSGKFATGAPRLDLAVADVRDVAKAHILAAETPTAKGRYLCVVDTVDFVILSDYVRRSGRGRKYRLATDFLPDWVMHWFGPLAGHLTYEFVWNNVGIPFYFDSRKIRDELGMTFTPVEASIVDMVESMERFQITR